MPIFPSLYLDFAILSKYGYIVSSVPCKGHMSCVLPPILYYSDYFRGTSYIQETPLGVTSVQLSTLFIKTSCSVKEAMHPIL